MTTTNNSKFLFKPDIQWFYPPKNKSTFWQRVLQWWHGVKVNVDLTYEEEYKIIYTLNKETKRVILDKEERAHLLAILDDPAPWTDNNVFGFEGQSGRKLYFHSCAIPLLKFEIEKLVRNQG